MYATLFTRFSQKNMIKLENILYLEFYEALFLQDTYLSLKVILLEISGYLPINDHFDILEYIT